MSFDWMLRVSPTLTVLFIVLQVIQGADRVLNKVKYGSFRHGNCANTIFYIAQWSDRL